VSDHFEVVVLTVAWYLSENIVICGQHLQQQQ